MICSIAHASYREFSDNFGQQFHAFVETVNKLQVTNVFFLSNRFALGQILFAVRSEKVNFGQN